MQVYTTDATNLGWKQLKLLDCPQFMPLPVIMQTAAEMGRGEYLSAWILRVNCELVVYLFRSIEARTAFYVTHQHLRWEEGFETNRLRAA